MKKKFLKYFSIFSLTALLVLFATIFLKFPSSAGSVSLDENFNNRSQYNRFDDTVSDIASQSDGKILVAGYFKTYNGISTPYITRLNADGGLDSSFKLIGTGFNNVANLISVQSDGKILVGGFFSAYNGGSISRLARLNDDGSLDTTFIATVVTADYEIDVIALQSDGKILIAGLTDTWQPYLMRLNTDGSLDSTFSIGTVPSSSINSIAIQQDGKIIIGGSFTSYSDTTSSYLVRLNTDGSLDTAFTLTGTSLNDLVKSVTLQSDGKILVGGDFTSYNGTAAKYIIRINTDGSLDNTFVQTGSGLQNYVTLMTLQSDGKILVGGYFSAYNNVTEHRLARLNSDGSLDTTFSLTGSGFSDSILFNSIVVQNTGKILVGGTFTSYNGVPATYLSQLDSDGTLDTTFPKGLTGLDARVNVLNILNDEKIIVGGEFTTYNGIPAKYVAKLKTDGTLDTSFTQTGTGLNGKVNIVALQSDEKVLVGGEFTEYNGTAEPYLVRLNSDGSLDTTFIQTGSGLNGKVYSLAVQGDGKVLVGGEFSSYNGTSTKGIARLNSDGSLDTTFVQTGSGLYNSFVQPVIVNTIAIQNDGKILVGGHFKSYNGTPVYNLVRFNTDGSIDTDFVQDRVGFSSDTEVLSLKLQSDGKILVGGYFPVSVYNEDYDDMEVVSRTFVTRLNTDGSLDTSFTQTGTGLDDYVRDIAVQKDGKIVVGGDFEYYNGTSTPHIARLNIDGSLDATFVQNSGGLDGIVFSIGLENDGEIVVGGMFTKYNGVSSAYITRLTGTDSVAPTGEIKLNSDSSYTTNPTVSLTISATDDLSGVAQMVLCNNSSFLGCTWETYVTGKTWSLSTGDGIKTVYAKFKDVQGNVSVSYSDTITLDTQAPLGSLTINSGANTTENKNVTLTITGSDVTSGISKMTVCNNSSFVGCNPETFSSSKVWSLTSGDGVKIVYVKLEDAVGLTTTFNDSILLNTYVAPVSTPIAENNSSDESSISQETVSSTITPEEVIKVNSIIDQADSSSIQKINQKNDVKVSMGGTEVSTNTKAPVSVYQDTEVAVSIPVDVLKSSTTSLAIDKVYAVLGTETTILTFDNVSKKYLGKVNTEKLTGSQNIKIVTVYEDDSSNIAILGISINPFGYVYSINESGNTIRIKDATLTLYSVSNTGIKTLYSYGTQKNPQTTMEDGLYSFIVEPGNYEIIVKADGYKDYDSGVFTVENTIIEKSIELKKAFNIFDYWGYCLLGLVDIVLLIIFIILLIKKKNKNKSTSKF